MEKCIYLSEGEEYFVLFKDGALLGFRAKPDPDQPLPDPLNDFTVKNVQIVSDSLKESESEMDTEIMEESSILSEVNRQITTTHEQLKMSVNSEGRDMMSMADAAEAARRDKIDEVAHTLTENRVLQRCKHPFLTEFTQAPVQLTPPSVRSGPLDTVDEMDEMQNNFVQFSFHNAVSSPLRDVIP
uniref:Protein kinase C-terminal domain-containing protein n=1 Tax=Wuchereria bancrofti TaxID=6293 RepID=A0A1I8EBQ7_WUCBA